VHWQHTTRNEIQRKKERKEEERKIEKLNSWPKLRKGKKRSQAEQSTNSTLQTARKLPLNKCKLPLNMWMQTSKFSEFFMKLTSSPPCWQCMNQGENANIWDKG
jgi:hypothetical protein